MLTITREQDSDRTVLHLIGRVDTLTAPELEAKIREESAELKALELDFGETDYISSAGLRVLLTAQRRFGRDGLKITHVNETVNEIFEITGFCDILTIE